MHLLIHLKLQDDPKALMGVLHQNLSAPGWEVTSSCEWGKILGLLGARMFVHLEQKAAELSKSKVFHAFKAAYAMHKVRQLMKGDASVSLRPQIRLYSTLSPQIVVTLFWELFAL